MCQADFTRFCGIVLEEVTMVSEAKKKADRKWEAEKTDAVRFRVPKGMRDKIKKCAELNGETVNEMLMRLVEAEMKRTFPNGESGTDSQ